MVPLDRTALSIQRDLAVLPGVQVRPSDGDQGSSVHWPVIWLYLGDVWQLCEVKQKHIVFTELTDNKLKAWVPKRVRIYPTPAAQPQQLLRLKAE